MEYQENGKKWKITGAAGLAAALFLCGTMDALVVSAAQSMNPSAKEYNLSVEDLPEGVSRAYAKLHDSSLDADSYMLSLFDGYDAMIAMEEALSAAGEDLAGIEYQAIEATVYEKDDEGDYYPLDAMQGITLICPLSENFAKHSSSVQVTAVDAKGALCRIDSKIVTVDGKDCVMFDLSVFTTYAILYKQSGALTSGRQPSPTPIPKKTDTNTAAAENTPTPTKAAEKTPTPKPAAPTKIPAKEEEVPTKAPVKEEKTPTKAPVKTENKTASAAQTSQKTPTKAPAKTGTASTPAPQRDRTPQTGDSYTPERYFALLAAGSTLAGFGMIFGRRKK